MAQQMPNEETILAKLREDGITTLEQLASQTVKKLEEQKAKGGTDPIVTATAWVGPWFWTTP